VKTSSASCATVRDRSREGTMSVRDIPGFLQAQDVVAFRLTYDRLPGLLRKRLDVPEGAVALVRGSSGQAKVVAAGASETDVKDGVLLKTARIELKFDVQIGRASCRERV